MSEESWKAEIEARLRTLETSHAIHADRYEAIKDRLDRIDQHVGRMLWIIGAAILGGFMTFIIQGGLTRV